METPSKSAINKALTLYKNPTIPMADITAQTGLSSSTVTRLAKKNKLRLRTAGRPATVQALLTNDKKAIATRKAFAKTATTQGVDAAMKETQVSSTAARAFIGRLRDGKDKFPGIKPVFTTSGQLLAATNPAHRVFSESAKIQKEVKSGKSVSAMAESYGVSPRTIKSALSSNKQTRR